MEPGLAVFSEPLRPDMASSSSSTAVTFGDAGISQSAPPHCVGSAPRAPAATACIRASADGGKNDDPESPETGNGNGKREGGSRSAGDEVAGRSEGWSPLLIGGGDMSMNG